MGKINLFFGSLPISLGASFATWLHIEASPENIEKINKYQLSNIELVLTSYSIGIGCDLYCWKALGALVTCYQKKQFNLKFTP